MASGKVIGQIQVSSGEIKITGVDGVVRVPEYGGFLHEGEQVISNDPDALFQVKYLALPEATAYDGVFKILIDSSVVAGMDAMDNMTSGDSLANALETVDEEVDIDDLETAAGEETVGGSSNFTPTDIVAESSVQDFNRGVNPDVDGLGGVEVGAEMEDNPNDTPVAIADTSVLNEDGSITVNVVANDIDRDGNIDPTTVIISVPPAHGSAIANPDGTVTYTPVTNYNGSDSFTYTVNDNDGGVSNPATVNLTVTPVNDIATISGTNTGGVTELEDATVVDQTPEIATLTATGTMSVLDEDEGESIFNTTVDQGSNLGSLSITEAGVWTYTIDNTLSAVQTLGVGDSFDESFTVYSVDGTDSEVITVTVTGTNDIAVITGTDTGGVTELVDTTADQSAEAGTLTATGTMSVLDVDDGEAIFNTTVDQGANLGSLSITTAGVWTYTIDNTLSAVQTLGVGDSFDESFTVYSADGTDAQVITVTVNGTNDIPTITDNTFYATEDIVYTITTADFPNFADIDGDSMTHIRIDTLPDNGILTLNGADVIAGDVIEVDDIVSGALYLTTLNNGDDTSFDFSVTDGVDWSVSQTMNVDVTPVTDTVRTDTLSISMTVLPPVIDTSILSMGDDINTADTHIFQTEGGLTLTSTIGTTVQVNTQGNGLGIDSGTGSNDPRDIEYGHNEQLLIQFPYTDETETERYTLKELNIDVKHTSGDEISIILFDVDNNPIISGVTFTNSDGVSLVLTDGNIDGNEVLSNGGDTIVINSDVAFDSLLIIDANAASSGGVDGFSILNVYGTASTNPDSYESVLNINGLGLSDTDGSEEISSITFSDFPTGSVITLADGTTEISADIDGNWVINADDLGLGGGDSIDNVEMTLSSPIAISTSFVPTIDILTSESETVPDSHTILGGTADSTLIGDLGDDYIDGGAGSDSISTGDGNDTIVYDTADVYTDGGTGVDTLIISANDTLDLSNVSNINTVQLEELASVTGTGESSGITATDVYEATDSGSNELIIQSSDGVGADNTVTIDTSTFSSITSDADYNIYSDGTSTLMIEIDIPIDSV